jgi:hypothetical protein
MILRLTDRRLAVRPTMQGRVMRCRLEKHTYFVHPERASAEAIAGQIGGSQQKRFNPTSCRALAGPAKRQLTEQFICGDSPVELLSRFNTTTQSPLHHVCHYQCYNRVLRRETAEARSQCLDHWMRDEVQPIPASTSKLVESAALDLAVWSNLYCRQLLRERLLPARRQQARYRDLVPRYQPSYVACPCHHIRLTVRRWHWHQGRGR